MKKISITAALAVATIVSAFSMKAQAGYSTTVENTPNLLGYWRFSPASQANSEVNGYTGTFMGNAAVGPANSGPSIIGDSSNSAVLLDGGSNTFVNTSLTGNIGQQGSIVGWFYLAQLPSDAGRAFYIAGESQVGNDLDLQIEPDNMLKFYTEAGGHTTDPIALTAADVNRWHFVAATFTAGTSRNIYLDGNLVGSSVPGGHSLNSSPFSMGASDVFGGRFFNGRLDEMAIFDRELSATEVGNIYAAAAAAPVITSPLAASGTVGQPFTYQFEASGATSRGASNLPAGLTFNAALSAIVGNPTAAGAFPVGLSATNAAGTTTATLIITVQPAPSSGPVIISGTAATGRTGQPFSFHVITRGGTPAARVSASGLPAGLSIDAVTGLISGTAAEGSSAVTLTVTDGTFTTSAVLQLTFTADPALPVIISPSAVALTPGQFFSYTINAPGSPDPSDPTIFTLIGTLPPGLSFNAATGTISGTLTGPLGPDLSGGTLLGSIQLFATNSHGTSTFNLDFRLAPSGAVNIATRLPVGTAANVLIGGFIVQGDAPKVVLVRAIGPSLTNFGVPNALQDPTLELHDSAHPDHVVLNDNWKDTQEQIIRDSGIAPTDDRESAIVIALDPGSYTAIVAGKNSTTGIAVVEVYDLGTAPLGSSGTAKLANIATRGFVDIGSNVMIGGFIVVTQPTRVVIRAIGPSLTQFGVPDALANPQLELHDATSLIAQNDDWQTTQIFGIITSDQVAEIQNSQLAPSNPAESAIIATLAPGSYTAIVRGVNNTTGNALVEVYALQ